MIDLQQIRELDLETVEPGHFVELGNEVVQALRAELGDEALKSIYDTAREKDRTVLERDLQKRWSAIPICMENF